jgi:predicted DNA-binding protein
MKASYRALKAFIVAWYDGYTSHGKFWLTLGIAALAVDAAISYQYGVSQTTLHGLGFALVAIFFALLPDAAYSEIEHRRIGSGIAMGCLCVPLGLVAFYSHLGYGAGVRVGDIQQTGVHNAKFEDTRESLKSDRANIDMWRKQLEELTTQNAWAATVKADSLRVQLETANKAIENETARRGCKAKCEAKMRERDAIAEKIGKVEQVESLTSRIEATQRIIDGKTKEASAATFKSSNVVNQTNVAAQVWKAMSGAKPEDAIAPDTVTTVFANLFIATGGSLAFMIMAPVGFFLAGRFRRKPEDEIASLFPTVDGTNTRKDKDGDTYISVKDPRGAAALAFAERLQRGIASTANHYSAPAMG